MPSHSSLSRQGRENHIEIIPSPLMGEGVKKWEFAPSPYHLPVREMVNPLKLIINFLPLDGGGAGWG
jgi:hypothetical protein